MTAVVTSFFTSTEEVARVVDSLRTLYHYGKDFKAFPEPYLELIMKRGHGVHCSYVHPGRGCVAYAVPKVRT